MRLRPEQGDKMPVKDSGYSAEWIRHHYRDYLQTEHWQDVRRRYKESRFGRWGCQVCGGRDGLQLHHKTYKRVGRERLTDLIYLCSNCHEKAHELLIEYRKAGKTKMNLWNIARKLRNRMGLRWNRHYRGAK